MKIRLGAALFNADHAKLGDEVGRLSAAGLDFVHLDVFDGYFVSDVGFAPRTIAALRGRTRLPFEVHMGVNDPLRFAPALVEAGVDLILFHIESVPMAFETLFAIRQRGVRAGVALSLGTPISAVEPLLGSCDAILLLSRVTGEGTRGAGFDESAFPRIRAVRDALGTKRLPCDLQAAGGINRTNAAAVAAAGATTLTIGSGIYKASDMARETAEIRAMAEAAALGAGAATRASAAEEAP